MAVILDSGNRTEYRTGAVRDMKSGKGRCDLMPLDVVAKAMCNQTLTLLSEYQSTKNVDYLFRILRLCRNNGMFPDNETMYLEVAKHFEEGAKKYGECNWQKGIPEWSYIDSAARHYLKWLRGDTDERHDRAFVWNIMCLIWTYEHISSTKTVGGKNDKN